MSEREIVLRGIRYQQEAQRAFVAAQNCEDEVSGTFIVSVARTCDVTMREDKYRVRCLKTRIVVTPVETDSEREEE